MILEPMFTIALIFATVLLIAYMVGGVFVLVVLVRDYLHRNDKESECDCDGNNFR